MGDPSCAIWRLSDISARFGKSREKRLLIEVSSHCTSIQDRQRPRYFNISVTHEASFLNFAESSSTEGGMFFPNFCLSFILNELTFHLRLLSIQVEKPYELILQSTIWFQLIIWRVFLSMVNWKGIIKSLEDWSILVGFLDGFQIIS